MTVASRAVMMAVMTEVDGHDRCGAGGTHLTLAFYHGDIITCKIIMSFL